MLNKNIFLKFFINFAVGSIFLTLIFYYFVSLPIQKSVVFALILSLVLDTAYILNKEILRRRVDKREEKETKLTRGDKFVLVMLSLVCIVYGTLGIHHLLTLPLMISFPIALILVVVFDSAYVVYVKRRKPRERRFYSFSQFLFESTFAFLIFLPTYLSGVDLLRSLAIALYVYIIFHWYYNYKPHVYVFSKKFLIFRSVLIFSATFLGWLTLVKVNLILSLLIATFTTFMLEVDRRSGVKLSKTLSFMEMEKRSKSANALFQPLGLIYGMLVGVMAVSNIYGSQYFAWWSLELYRLAYIFTTAFLIVSALISWICVGGKFAR